jgi:KDO2-lipid IV(A) lauroyltransferase
MPFWLLYRFSDLLYVIVYHLVGYRKKVVMSNLELVFPNKSDSERKLIARAFYRHLCDLIFETIKNLTISEREMRRRFRVDNLALTDRLFSQHRSAILLCGHYGSWEWSGIMNRMVPHKCQAVYKELDNPYFDRLVRKIRGRFGGEIISRKKVVSRLFRLEKKGERTLTLILADQTPKFGGFKHRDLFMGIDVPVFTGPEELAKKLDMVLLYLHIEKIKRGYYSARIVILEENPATVDDFKLTRKFFDLLEGQIKKAPALYLWSHKRWKLRN